MRFSDVLVGEGGRFQLIGVIRKSQIFGFNWLEQVQIVLGELHRG